MFPFFLKDRDFEAPDVPIQYILARNGLYVVKRSSVFTSCTRVEGLPWLDDLEEGYRLNAPKLPAWVLAQSLAFFRAVYGRFGSEAILLIHYAPASGEYRLDAPPQEVAPLSCFYEPQPVPEGQVKVGSIHSHGQLPGVHSEADEEDERFDDGLHIALGRILSDQPSLDCELVIGASRFVLNPSEALELTESSALGVSDDGFPEEWLNMVTGAAGRPPTR